MLIKRAHNIVVVGQGGFAKALHIHQEGSNVVRVDLLTNAIKFELVEKRRIKKLLSGTA